MNQQSADEDLLRRVNRTRESLARIASKAEQSLDAMKKDFEARLKEQEKIVLDAEVMRNQYNRQSLRWERENPSLPLGSTYQVKKKMFKYSRNMGTMLEVPYPWLATPPPPAATPPPPPPLPQPPRPKRKVRVVADDDSSEDDVVEMGQSSWHDRDAALRKKAIALDSCVVDEVFRKFSVTKWTH